MATAGPASGAPCNRPGNRCGSVPGTPSITVKGQQQLYPGLIWTHLLLFIPEQSGCDTNVKPKTPQEILV